MNLQVNLQAYPRPNNDNGIGLHFRLDLTETPRKPNVSQGVEWLQAINAKWTLIAGQDWIQICSAARIVWRAGIMPVCRLIGKIDDPSLDWETGVKRLLDQGTPPYIQIFNEPGDPREWRSEQPDILRFGKNWADAAARVFDAGGYPGVGAVLGQDEWRAAFNAVQANGRSDIWEKAWFCVHNYGSNHPPAYPYDDVNQKGIPITPDEYAKYKFSLPLEKLNELRSQGVRPGATILDDDTAALRFLAYKQWMLDSLGFCLPMIGGEGGWQFQAQDDLRYPQVSAELHARYTREMFEWFRSGKLSDGSPLPDELFCCMPWIQADGQADSWWLGPLGTKQMTIDAVANIPTFVRAFGAEDSGALNETPAKSKLGVYVISLVGIDILDYVRRAMPRVIVSMDHNPDIWRQVKEFSPNTFLLGRHYLDDGQQRFNQPESDAENLFKRMTRDAEKMRGIYDAWMGYNESIVRSDAEAANLSRFYVEWARLMRDAGFKTAAYSFAAGNPPAGFSNPDGKGSEPNYWRLLEDGLSACDYLSLHEYSAPHLQDQQGYLLLRYRRVYELLSEDARKPIIISECGIDGGVIPDGSVAQRGWALFTDEEGYLSELKWYDDNLLADDYVLGAAIFTMNSWGMEGSYSIAKANKIRDYIGRGGSPPPFSILSSPVAQAGQVTFGELNRVPADYQVGVNELAQYEIWEAHGAPIPNLLPPIGIAEPNAAVQIVRRLEHLAQYHSILELEHQPGSPLADQLLVQLLKPPQGWQPGQELDLAACAPLGPDATLDVGEYFVLQLTSKSANLLHFSVLVLSPDWKVTQIWPRFSESSASIKPEETLSQVFRANLDDRYNAGTDWLEVFASPQAFDLRVLELPTLDQPTQEARDTIAPSNVLNELASAMTSGTSSTIPPNSTTAREWVVVQVQLRISREYAAAR